MTTYPQFERIQIPGDHAPAIVDGAVFTAQRWRGAEYLAVNGDWGVLGDSLQVVAMPQPTGKVQILPGVGVLEGAPPGASPYQSYSVLRPRATTVDIPVNATSSHVAHEIWVTVRDPQHSGEPVVDMWDDYTDIVRRSGTVAVPGPKMLLAAVVVPANTAAITQEMISDRRRFLARESSVGSTVKWVETTHNGLNGTATSIFPAQQTNAPIPPWASRLVMKTTIRDLLWNGTGLSTGNTWPRPGGGLVVQQARNFRQKFGALEGKTRTIIGYDQAPAQKQVILMDEFDVKQYRGATHAAYVISWGSAANHDGARWIAEAGATTVEYDMRFYAR